MVNKPEALSHLRLGCSDVLALVFVQPSHDVNLIPPAVNGGSLSVAHSWDGGGTVVVTQEDDITGVNIVAEEIIEVLVPVTNQKSVLRISTNQRAAYLLRCPPKM